MALACPHTCILGIRTGGLPLIIGNEVLVEVYHSGLWLLWLLKT